MEWSTAKIARREYPDSPQIAKTFRKTAILRRAEAKDLTRQARRIRTRHTTGWIGKTIRRVKGTQ